VGPHVGLDHNHVQIRKEHGGGYPANVEGLHHLHCANLVRQALYYNIDYYRAKGEGAFVNEEPIVQKHVCESPSSCHSEGVSMLIDDPSSLLGHYPSAIDVYGRHRSVRPSLVAAERQGVSRGIR
jgi:hypothetical protein